MVSVCMAVHNGAQYVASQLQSILVQLGADDEVIVVDDASTDDSAARIAGLADHRIRILTNRVNLGIPGSFAKALQQARGDVIFFADQDDLWLPGKVTRVLEEFARSDVLAVVTDAVVIDDAGTVLHDSYFAWRGSGPGVVRNFYKSTFLGCCMALRQECRRFLLPFPPLTYMHDQWAGLACSLVGRVSFLPQPLLAYRRHGRTYTQMQRSPWGWIARRRALLLLSLLCAAPRLLAWRWRLALR